MLPNIDTSTTDRRPKTDHNIRPATQADAEDLARLVDLAGEGLASYVWQTMATEGQSVWDVGRQRAMREEGSSSYRNATVIETGDGHLAGSLVGYTIGANPEPVPDDIPPMFRPLLELENLAPETWYVNVLAVYPRHQGHGYGTALLEEAGHRAEAAGQSRQSIIVSNANEGAFRLYRRAGFTETARRPMIKENWRSRGTEWILMIKPQG